MKAKRLALAGLMATTLGSTVEVSAATALSVAMDFKGYVTMLDSTGKGFRNTSYYYEERFGGWRTPINGTMVMDITETGMIGRASFKPFMFAGLAASGRDITFVPEDTLFGTPIPTNTLLVGNMLFDYGPTLGIPVSIVLDMGNLSTALMSASVGDVITGALRSASDNTLFAKQSMPIGPVVVATTTWDTTDVDTDGDGQPGPLAMNVNPSGTIPLLVDTVLDSTNGDVGIGGSRMKVGPFPGFSPNFDITEVTITCVNALSSCSTGGIPVPAIPLDPAPLQPVQDTLGDLFK